MDRRITATPVLKSSKCDDSKKFKAHVEKKRIIRASNPKHASYGPWQKWYKGHLKAIENAKAVTDTSEPLVPNRGYLGFAEYNRRLIAFQRMEEENAEFLKRIADVYIHGGKIDNEAPKTRPGINKGIQRRDQLLRLMCENVNIYERIKNVVSHFPEQAPIMSRKEQLTWYAKQEKVMSEMSLYPLFFKPQPCSPFVVKILKYAAKYPVRQAYFIVQTGKIQEQCKITVELFAKQAPFTVANFEKLIETKNSECGRTYRCKKFEKLVSISRKSVGSGDPQYWRVANSTGVFPQFAKHVVGEDSKRKHETAWLLTKPKQIATGEFYITVAPALYLDKLCTVFGKIDEVGQKFLDDMQKMNVDPLGYPISPIFITDCGLISPN